MVSLLRLLLHTPVTIRGGTLPVSSPDSLLESPQVAWHCQYEISGLLIFTVPAPLAPTEETKIPLAWQKEEQLTGWQYSELEE